MRHLDGQRALLTGASGGLGGAIAQALAGAGVDLALSGRDEAALAQVAAAVRARGRTAAIFPADLTRHNAAMQLAAAAAETAGPIDILVNCAGVEIASAYTRYSEAELDGIMRLDLLAPLWLIQALLPGMLARGSGHVVNICSLASRGPLPYGVPYAAAKWGLAGATHSLRLEYAGSGIGFSVVIPGFVTGAGIFARHQAAGIAAPAVFGTVTPELVGRAVVRAIRRNAPELVVSRHPIRPLLALAVLAPRFAEMLTGWVGVTKIARQVAALEGRRDEPQQSAQPRQTSGVGPQLRPERQS
jgi:short-subunit dehydrogenase